MNRLLCAASIVALLVPAAAVAQHQGDQQHGGGRGHQAQGHQARPAGGGQHQGRPAGGAQPSAQAMQAQRTVQRQTSARPGQQQQTSFRSGANQRGGYRASNVRRVQAPTFRYPSGYRYRRWTAGSILPSIFLGGSYFYNEWSTVGAYPPPPGFVWVRYGPDLLLVSRRSGRIRDVLYGVFY